MAEQRNTESVLARLEEEVAFLRSRLAISDLERRYARAFDRNDVELLRSCFWPDAQINYGDQHNTVDDFIVSHLKMHTEQLVAWGHLLTNENVDVAGDTAHCETYVTGLFMPRADSTVFDHEPMMVAGRYIDRIDRRGDEWRIAVREFVMHYSNERFFSQWAPEADREHAWDRQDLSYLRPLGRRE